MMNADTMYLLGEIVAKVLMVIVLFGLAFLGWRVFKVWWQSRQAKLSAELAEPEAGAITENMQNLSKILADVERDGSKASLLLLDAQTYTQNLVDLIAAIALKAEAMAQEADILQDALASITSQDPLQIAQAAGRVGDQHIRTLMLTKVKDLAYWQDTSMLIATQVGTLTQWQQGYRRFASNLLSEVSKAKSQLAAQTAALELVGTSRPLLQAQANLGEAQHYLQLQRNPGLHEAAKQLPAINAGLLR